MRYAILSLLPMLLASGWLHAAPIEVTVYADDSYPPYSYADQGGKPQGIYAEILKIAFSRMPEYRVTIEAIPWRRGLKMMEEGQAFALYPPYYRYPERPYLWPYSLAILQETVVVFCHVDTMNAKPRRRWPEDFYGLRIGNNAGFIQGGAAFRQAVKEGKIVLDDNLGSRENILKVLQQRLDCYMNDRLSIQAELEQLKRMDRYEDGVLVEAAIVGSEEGYLGFCDSPKANFPYKDDFVRRFNTVLYGMKQSGEIQQLFNRFIRELHLGAP